MRAAFMFGAGDVRIENVPDPKIQKPTDAIVRTVRSCICGSDLHPYHSLPASEQGTPMGHELIGIVEETGSAVSTVKKGDFVIVPFSFSDNTCSFCRDGFHTACKHGGFYGTPEVGGLQAELSRIPLADGSLVVVPGVTENDSALFPSLLTLSDVYLTGHHAAHMGRVEPGKTVTVIGDGAVGLSAVLAAKQLGAETIILMGRHTARTDLGRDFGATHVVAERGDEGIAEVMEITGGEGSHVVLEAVGTCRPTSRPTGSSVPVASSRASECPSMRTPPSASGPCSARTSLSPEDPLRFGRTSSRRSLWSSTAPSTPAASSTGPSPSPTFPPATPPWTRARRSRSSSPSEPVPTLSQGASMLEHPITDDDPLADACPLASRTRRSRRPHRS
ncbi:putative zinc-type alcohol dehydrogenase-like protein YjmD [Rathayibacter tanaceti]|uniref:Putative zinc-type alcohol dehydrogenase-like protein YjmD n=1 Tax=Rathayibacter tanaceti TaxID=1671680 RepID=A0A166IKX2_9MICO|nr:putative zinc-type alcohol dehydrogenase-like protein YjmD [Rathayibacter tanaceti]